MADKTVTVMPSGGTYATLAAAIAGELSANANLVSMAGILHIKIDGTWSSADSTSVNLTGFTVNSSYYVDIYTTVTSRHLGVWSSSYYQLAGTYDWNTKFIINNAYSRVTGLQIQNTSTSGGSGVEIDAGPCQFIASIIRGCQQYGVIGKDGNNIMANCVVSGNLSGGLQIGQNGTQTWSVYNCAFVNNGGYGIYVDEYRTILAKNCYAGGNATAGYGHSTNGTLTPTTCYSDDGSLSTTVAAWSTSSGGKFTNVTSGSENIHIKSGSTLIAAGTDLHADGTYPFAVDIDGQARPNGSWDVGPDQYIAAGGGGVGGAMLARFRRT